MRLGAAAALDHGTGLRARQRPAVPDEDQLRRAARHHDERFPRDRANLRAVRAAGLGINRRRRPCPGDGLLPAQAEPLRARHEDGIIGAGAWQALNYRGYAAVPRITRPAWLYAAPLGGDRRLGPRSR